MSINIITKYFDAGDAGFSLRRPTSVNQRHFKTNQPASPASLCQKIGDAGDAGKKNCPELDDPDTKYPNMFSVEDRLDEESPDGQHERGRGGRGLFIYGFYAVNFCIYVS